MLIKTAIIKKLPSGKYRLYSRKKDKSGKRRNLGTYDSLAAVKKREKAIQYFKHHAEDGAVDDKETAALSKLSDIAQFLEKAGFVDAADKVYIAMDAVDGSLDSEENEDNIVDMFIVPDIQNNVGGSIGAIPGSAGGGSPGLFSIDEAEKIASIANKLDKMGFFEEANIIDLILKQALSTDIFEIIKKLDQSNKDKKSKKVVKNEQDDKQKEDVVARSNGRVGTGVTDNQNAGSFQGFSDAYFYSGYGNLEGIYGPR